MVSTQKTTFFSYCVNHTNFFLSLSILREKNILVLGKYSECRGKNELDVCTVVQNVVIKSDRKPEEYTEKNVTDRKKIGTPLIVQAFVEARDREKRNFSGKNDTKKQLHRNQ